MSGAWPAFLARGEKCELAGSILLLNKVVLQTVMLPDGRASEALVNFLFLLG